MSWSIQSLETQAESACIYYVLLIVTMRLAGKRLAGQTTSFDLIVLITIAVVLQNAILRPGPLNAFMFAITVLVAHRFTAWACSRCSSLRRVLRGSPKVLVRNGRALQQARREEGISEEELRAGLRKLGHETERTVQLATLEETGHISVVSLHPNQSKTQGETYVPRRKTALGRQCVLRVIVPCVSNSPGERFRKIFSRVGFRGSCGVTCRHPPLQPLVIIADNGLRLWALTPSAAAKIVKTC